MILLSYVDVISLYDRSANCFTTLIDANGEVHSRNREGIGGNEIENDMPVIGHMTVCSVTLEGIFDRSCNDVSTVLKVVALLCTLCLLMLFAPCYDMVLYCIADTKEEKRVVASRLSLL